MKLLKESAYLDDILGHHTLDANAKFSDMLKAGAASGCFQHTIDLSDVGNTACLEMKCTGRDFQIQLTKVWLCSYTEQERTLSIEYADGDHSIKDLRASVGAIAYAKMFDLLPDCYDVTIACHHEGQLKDVVKLLKRAKKTLGMRI